MNLINQCGQFSAAAILYGFSFDGNYSIWAILDAWKGDADEVPDYPTSPSQLADFINGHYSDIVYVAHGHIEKWLPGNQYWTAAGEGVVANKLPEWVTSYQVVIAGVTMRPSGFLDANFVKPNGDKIGHWVVITGYSHEWERLNNRQIQNAQTSGWKYKVGLQHINDSGWNWVRVYNPYDNQTEYYPWKHFWNAWKANGAFMITVSNQLLGDWYK